MAPTTDQKHSDDKAHANCASEREIVARIPSIRFRHKAGEATFTLSTSAIAP